MALVRATADLTGAGEYDVRVGVEWAGEGPLTILTRDTMGFVYDEVSTPLHRYTPVETTVLLLLLTWTFSGRCTTWRRTA